jgi:hypothetical protein
MIENKRPSCSRKPTRQHVSNRNEVYYFQINNFFNGNTAKQQQTEANQQLHVSYGNEQVSFQCWIFLT